MNVQISSDKGLSVYHHALNADARVLLLTEVDFKWLMAGQGWWVNTHRFHADPRYAAGLLRLAASSPCAALRECALALQAQADGVTARGVAP